MEGIGIEDQRYRQNSYGGPPVQDSRRPMPPAGPLSHGIPQSSSAPPSSSWSSHPHTALPPPASSNLLYDRPGSAQSQSQPQPYGSYPSRGDYPPAPPAPSYSRSNSLSTPKRSPVEGNIPNHPALVNGHAHDGPPSDYYGPGEYRGRPGYGPMEVDSSGKQGPHPMPSSSGRESVPVTPSGPPPAPPQHPGPTHPPGHYPGQPPPLVHGMPLPLGPGNRPSPITYEQVSGGYWPPQMTTTQAYPPRQRGHRAQHACENCRTRKAKCDEGKPTCTHCLENQLQCHYRDLQPQKQEKSGQAHMDILLSLQQGIDTITHNLQNVTSTLASQDKALAKLNAKVFSDAPSPQQGIQRVSMQRQTSASNESSGVRAETKSFTENLEDPSVVVSVSQPAEVSTTLPMDHTTAAHEMLGWPALKLLTKGREINMNYVTDGEWSRGLLRLHGRGEGENKDDSAKSVASPAASVANSDSDDQTLQNAPSPDAAWGFSIYSPEFHPVIPEDHPGGLAQDGRLKLDHTEIDSYVKSYLQNMYTLHPILDPKKLRAAVTKFKQWYSPWKPSALGKRKRDVENKPPHHSESNLAPRYPEVARTIGNAMIVLVLALGKICAHKDGPLPGPARGAGGSPPSSHPTFRSNSAVSSAPPSAQSSPSMSLNVSMAQFSPPAGDSRTEARNLDVIPGLAYFAWAAGVLGEHQGGSDLEHCQAYLLAALYYGQLAHPASSYGWISQACSACIGLIRRSATLMKETHRDSRSQSKSRIQVDLIETCYWTCSQLESDIRAELKSMQPSGISQYEEFMDSKQYLPTDAATDPTDTTFTKEDISIYYNFQLYIRKNLNQVHQSFYDPKKKGRVTMAETEACSESLDDIRKLLNHRIWDDGEEPAGDILAARLRAKFYGGRNIIHRPMLEDILQEEYQRAEADRKGRVSESPHSSTGTQSLPHSPAITHGVRNQIGARFQHDMKPPGPAPPREMTQGDLNRAKANLPKLTPQQEQLVPKAIESIIYSTEAFDRVPGRLIVTNIFGTLHAQFGNMLVLAAASLSPRLKKFVDKLKLFELLKSTIGRLSELRELSPTLREDALILQVIQKNLESALHEESTSTGSFTSQDT